jgi:hypothetical protein
MEYTCWTKKEISQCKQLYKEGKTITEIANTLDKGVLSVINLLTTERTIKNPNPFHLKRFRIVNQDSIQHRKAE